jgi:hypothetical protein
MDTDELWSHAVAYAVRGWPVLPVWWPLAGACACGRPDCSKPGKHPLIRRGFHAATTDLDLIRRWWTRWPFANVGIRTGAASGLLVVDIDGAAGMESLRTLSAGHGPLHGAWVRSGSGGWHVYLRCPDGQRVPSSVARIGPGIDVRAEGGSIVAPPSRHASGGRYRWAQLGVEPPSAPGWLVERALPPPLPAVSFPVKGLLTSDRYAAAAIEGESTAVATAPVGTRNHRLNLAAWRLGRLAGGGIVDPVVAREALLAAAAAAGLPPHESAGTVRSGLTAGQRDPRRPTTPRPAEPASTAALDARRWGLSR